jgi:hypothetical protein
MSYNTSTEFVDTAVFCSSITKEVNVNAEACLTGMLRLLIGSPRRLIIWRPLKQIFFKNIC